MLKSMKGRDRVKETKPKGDSTCPGGENKLRGKLREGETKTETHEDRREGAKERQTVSDRVVM